MKKATFKIYAGNHHTDYIGMSEEMLERIAKRITSDFKETNELDLSFLGNTKLKWLEDLLLGFNPWLGRDRPLMVTGILAERLWTLILDEIEKKEYVISGFDLKGISENAFGNNLELKKYVEDKKIIVKKKENGISYSTLGIRGIQERVLNRCPIEFVEWSIKSDCYKWEDIDHSLEIEFNLWLDKDAELLERYSMGIEPCSGREKVKKWL